MAPTSAWNPESYAKNARFVAELGEPLLPRLDAKPGETILDLGCGDGALTEKIAASGAKVYGIDASLAQTQASKRRALDVLVMDGRRLGFKQCFDAVFTNAALHWIKQPEKVIAGVWNCLKPGGRFVGEFGGEGNVDGIRSALHAGLRRRGIDPWTVDPWYYPSAEQYSQLLTAAGFTVGHMELIPRPTPLPGDIVDWLEVFAQPLTRSVAESERNSLVDEVRAELKPALCDRGGRWIADYVRLRFKAERRVAGGG
jgi:trans-aconitate methyltransferase